MSAWLCGLRPALHNIDGDARSSRRGQQEENAAASEPEAKSLWARICRALLLSRQTDSPGELPGAPASCDSCELPVAPTACASPQDAKAAASVTGGPCKNSKVPSHVTAAGPHSKSIEEPMFAELPLTFSQLVEECPLTFGQLVEGCHLTFCQSVDQVVCGSVFCAQQSSGMQSHVQFAGCDLHSSSNDLALSGSFCHMTKWTSTINSRASQTPRRMNTCPGWGSAYVDSPTTVQATTPNQGSLFCYRKGRSDDLLDQAQQVRSQVAKARQTLARFNQRQKQTVVPLTTELLHSVVQSEPLPKIRICPAAARTDDSFERKLRVIQRTSELLWNSSAA